jgi:hypothetical protein
METALDYNGADLAAEDGDVIAFMLGVAQGVFDLDDITSWIRGNLENV